MKLTRFASLVAALLLAACGGEAATLPPQPSPTIAVAPPVPTAAPPTAAPLVLAPGGGPVSSPTPSPPAGQAAPATTPAATSALFEYLWPAYLPDGMRVSKNESRVAQENQIGTTGTGFYVVTLNGADRKLVVGGGATDALPLAGDARELDLDGAAATLTTAGEQRQLVFTRNAVKFFVYGKGLSEQDLLLVAQSLLPIDAASLRQQVEAGS